MKAATLKEKLRICRYILTGENKPMIMVSCHYCGSPLIKYENGIIGDNTYTSDYTCAKCGAKATNVETWHIDEVK